MKIVRVASVWAVVLVLALAVAAQDNGSSDGQNSNNPVLKTRPHDGQSSTPAQTTQGSLASASQPAGGPPNAIPDGTRFIVKLADQHPQDDSARAKGVQPAFTNVANQLAKLQGNGVADRVRNVESGCASLDYGFQYLKKKLRLSAGRIFRREFDVIAKRAWNESVISRIVDGAVKDAVQSQETGFLVQFVLDARTERDLDDAVEFLW